MLDWSLSHPSRMLRALRRPDVAVAFQPTLRVNAEDRARDLIVMSEDRGIDEIRALGETTGIEEAWAHVPDAGFWFEIGVYGRDDASLGPLVEIDVALLGRLIETFDRVHVYHLHPRATFSAAFGKGGIYNPQTPVSDLSRDDGVAVGLALPSPEDIETAIQIGLLQEKLRPASHVPNYVVSPYGVVEYRLTGEARREIALNQGNPIRSLERSLITVASIRRAAFNIEQTMAQSPTMTIAGLIDVLSEQLNGDSLVVRYVRRW